MTAVVGESKRVFTVMWNSTNRTLGTKSNYRINLSGAPWLAQHAQPKAYRMFLSTVAFWGGNATPTTTRGTLYMHIDGLTVTNTMSTFGGGGGSKPIFIIPLTSTQYVDQNGVTKQPIVVSAFESPSIGITFLGDDSQEVTDLLDHAIVLTLEPIYD